MVFPRVCLMKCALLPRCSQLGPGRFSYGTMSDNPESKDTGRGWGAFPHSSPLPQTVPTCLQKPPTELSVTFQYKILTKWFGFAKKKYLNKIYKIKVLECLMHSSAPCFVDFSCHRLRPDLVFLNLVIGDTPRGSRLPTPVHFPAQRRSHGHIPQMRNWGCVRLTDFPRWHRLWETDSLETDLSYLPRFPS